MIYENIDRGVYDLSSDKSGIRVGNESFNQPKPEPKKLTDKNNTGGGGKGGCC
jgi:hypothetical protein